MYNHMEAEGHLATQRRPCADRRGDWGDVASSQGTQQPWKLKEAKGINSSLEHAEGRLSILTQGYGFQTPGLQSCETISLHILSTHQVCAHVLQQPQEANTEYHFS